MLQVLSIDEINNIMKQSGEPSPVSAGPVNQWNKTSETWRWNPAKKASTLIVTWSKDNVGYLGLNVSMSQWQQHTKYKYRGGQKIIEPRAAVSGYDHTV